MEHLRGNFLRGFINTAFKGSVNEIRRKDFKAKITLKGGLLFMKRLFVLLIALFLMLSVILVGCGETAKEGSSEPSEGKTEESTPKGEKSEEKGPVTPAGELPIVKEPITLTIFKEPTGLAQQTIDNWQDNEVLKYITEKTNIKLDIIFLSQTDPKQQLVLALTSGDYPDAAILDWNAKITYPEVMQYGVKEKILYPLNDLIDKYGFELKKIFELRPTYRAMITAPDGNIYGLPRFTECYHCMSYPKLWFNYAWLEKLGLKEPQTTDELYEVLKAFKTQDPNGNGKADEIPLTGCIEWACPVENWILNCFIVTPPTISANEQSHFLSWIDNKVTFVANRPEFKMAIEYMKKLYDEGLLDPAAFTQNTEGLSQQCRGEEVIVGAYTADHIGMGVDFDNQKDVADMYHALPPVEGPTGARYQSYNPPEFGGYNFVIFDTCKYPEAAFRLADFLLSEDMLFVQHYGMKGVTWDAPEDPNAKNIEGGPLKCVPITLPADATEEEQIKYYNNTFWGSLMGDLRERRAMWTPEATPENLRNLYEVRIHWETMKTEKYWPEVALPRTLFMDQEEADEFAELKTSIVGHVRKNIAMFVTGARSLDEWDDYVEELNRFGVERYVELYSKAYDNYLKNLGQK